MKVGFIGLGTMGGSMALNIRKAGYELTVYDLRREAAKASSRSGGEMGGAAARCRHCSGCDLHVSSRHARSGSRR
jgi:3-hydroxyisobutyrate dehydrogenase-like beta-hydroxyacid dehydrogenase